MKKRLFASVSIPNIVHCNLIKTYETHYLQDYPSLIIAIAYLCTEKIGRLKYINLMNKKLKPTQTNRKRTIAFLSIIILTLIIGIGVLGSLMLKQKRKAEDMRIELLAEKDSISVELRHVLVEFDNLETENKEMQEKIAEEKTRVEQLIKEVNTVRQIGLDKIRAYQRELGTLRAIMRNMVEEIDSLNTLNQTLIAENTSIRTQYSESQRSIEKLTEEKASLSDAVSKGQTVQVRNVVLEALNKRDVTTQRARYTKKIKCCFTLLENSIALAGPRFAYIRITSPDGILLLDPEDGQFTVNEQTLAYSARREIDYQNADIDLCIFYHGAQEYTSGKYTVQVYFDGKLVGEGETLLR